MGNDPQYDSNQLRAFHSWLLVADAIVYFNEPQAALRSPKTRFIPAEPFPMLRELVDFCADQPTWCAVLNADIVVTPVFKRLEQKLKDARASAASSWRWTFDPAIGLEPCEHNDNGLDFFAAVPGAWDLIYQQDAMKHLRMGAPSWDAWLLGAFYKLFQHGFYNLTKHRCIRHPKHDGRKHAQISQLPHFIGWPVMGELEIP